MPNPKRYAQVFYKTRREMKNITTEGLRNMTRLVTDLRKNVSDVLRDYSPGDPSAPFVARILPNITKSIGEATDEYLKAAGGLIDVDMTRAFNLGAQDMSRSIEAGNVDVGKFQPSVSRELLVALSQDTSDVLSEIISNLDDRIVSQIRLAATGMQPASEVSTRIARMIAASDEVEQNLRTRIGFDAQADAITRTEVNRAFSVAHQSASEGFAEKIPGLKKTWVASGNGRKTHEDAEDRYSVGGTEGPIPIDAYFEVEDDSRTGMSEFFSFSGRGGTRVARTAAYPRSGVTIHDRLLFPRDPNGSPGSVLNCSCFVREIIPGLEEAGQVDEEDAEE